MPSTRVETTSSTTALPPTARNGLLGMRGLAAASLVIVWAGFAAVAQDEPAPAGEDRDDGALSTEQERIAGQYRRFEKTLLQMAEYMRKTDPQRADLLIRAIGRSKEVRVLQNMEQISALLESERFGDAIDQQAELVEHLRGLLELLQSEDRKSEIEKEKERIQEILKDLGRIIAQEKDVRASTERGGDARRLADRQQEIADETGSLGKKIDAQDAEKNAQADADRAGDESQQDSQQNSQGKAQDDAESNKGEGKSGKPSEQDAQQSRPGESQDRKQADQPPNSDSQNQAPSQSQQSGDSPPQQGSPQQSQGEAQQQTPGRKELEQALQEMERAIQELKKEAHDDASDHQDEALAELEEAKEKLEEILRQLREEERELMLAALEARFQKMLAMQLMVYNGTVSLAKTPKDQWSSRHFGRSRELSQRENEIALEASKALMILKEEGSSVAFPEAVEQLQQDMLTVVRLLERSEVGELTQGIERDIVEALQELVEALQREMEKNSEQQQQNQQQAQQGDPSLVDTLAELKMLRSLQMRVNRRTKRLGQLIDGEQALDVEILNQLRELSYRQARIQGATYDLSIGRNQ